MRKFLVLIGLVLIMGTLCACSLLPAGGSFLQANPTVYVTHITTPTPSPTPTPTPEPTATPVPVPTPTPIITVDGYQQVAEYSVTRPDRMLLRLQYDRYETFNEYCVALSKCSVYERADKSSGKLFTFSKGSRLRLTHSVIGADRTIWYRVTWQNDSGEWKVGFAPAEDCSPRIFQFDKILEHLDRLDERITGSARYISNYKNVNGQPPKVNDKSRDVYGYRRSQSAPGYAMASKESAMRYIPDGMLVIPTGEEENGFVKVYIPSFNGEYWVPAKYISPENKQLSELTQVACVDVTNQNIVVLEKGEGGRWYIVSMCFVTTGVNGEFSLETPVGDYMAIEKRSGFFFYKDGTQEFDGYAPYVTRFSGGAYLHGVSIGHGGYDERGEVIAPDKSAYKESTSTLGTVPLSHMCVRNYTSHAKFLHSYLEIGKACVVVIK